MLAWLHFTEDPDVKLWGRQAGSGTLNWLGSGSWRKLGVKAGERVSSLVQEGTCHRAGHVLHGGGSLRVIRKKTVRVGIEVDRETSPREGSLICCDPLPCCALLV